MNTSMTFTAVVVAVAALAIPTGADAATVTNGAVTFTASNQVHTVNPDGTTPRQLTTVGVNSHPVWSPDGKHIAYLNQPAGGVRSLWTMNPNGTGKAQVTSSKVALGPGGAAWSPDSSTLAFGGPNENPPLVGDVGPFYLDHIKATAVGGTPATYRKDLPRFGTINVSDVRGPVAWAPSAKIAYTSGNWASDQPSDFFLLACDPAATSLSEYTESGADVTGYLSNPAYKAGTTTPAFEMDLTIVGDTDTGSVVVFPGFPQTSGDHQPAFGPGGRVALMHYRNNVPSVYLADLSGAHRAFLTAGHDPSIRPVT